MAKKPPGRKAPRKKPKYPKPPPKCKAMLLCNHVIIEKGTENVSIIGTFTVFGLMSVPGHTRPAMAFLQLVDGNGHYDVTVEVRDLQQNEVLARSMPIPIDFPEKLCRINLVIPIPALRLSHTGFYDVAVMADGQEIEKQQFEAASRGESNDTDESGQS